MKKCLFVILLLSSGYLNCLAAELNSQLTTAQDPQETVPNMNTPQEVTPLDIGELVPVLMFFFVLSVLFEVALTTIFNWRIFLKYFEGKGIKTIITTSLAFLLCQTYDLDIFSTVLSIFGYTEDKVTFIGKIITALLIAGGSDGIFRIFVKLNIRNPAERKQKAQQSR